MDNNAQISPIIECDYPASGMKNGVIEQRKRNLSRLEMSRANECLADAMSDASTNSTIVVGIYEIDRDAGNGEVDHRFHPIYLRHLRVHWNGLQYGKLRHQHENWRSKD